MDPNNIIAFCQSRVAQAHNAEDQRLWQFMQVIFEADARHRLLDTLGFNPTEISAKVAAYSEDSTTNGVANMSFDDKKHGEMSQGTQNFVKQALMVGNFEAAVECCFNTGNLADALVLASCGGAELWAKTQDRYFQSQAPKRPFLSVVGAIISQDFVTFVQTSDPAKWKETLAILSTYGKSDEFPQLCAGLGDLLEAAGDHSSASLCYLCSLSLDKAVKYWRTQLLAQNSQKGGKMDLLALHEYVVKTSVYLQAVGTTAQLSVEDAATFSKYAEKLAEQGLLVAAAKYCKGDSMDSKILRDRLYRSRASQKCLAAMGGSPPEFPYVMQDVKQYRGPARNTANRGYGTQVSSVSSASGYSQQQQAYAQEQPAAAAAPVASNALLAGWMELQDPGSGRTYYANQTTGEVTWERPQATPSPVVAPAPSQPTTQQQSQSATASTNSRNTKLASKYGDGFVSSASHPELASQYGNVGTSNPYHSTARPGTAQVSSASPARAPVSGNLDTIPDLKPEYQPISDTLLSLIEALKGGQLAAVDKRQLSEGEKGVAIFTKLLARGEISDEIANKMLSMTNSLSSYDWAAASSIQTALVSHEWRDHKDWLKGIKALVQLATKLYSR
jgi:protein transport protein SEC31